MEHVRTASASRRRAPTARCDTHLHYRAARLSSILASAAARYWEEEDEKIELVENEKSDA